MVEVVLLIILVVVMLGIFIFLYSQGYMVSKSISAVAFIGSAKGNSARFSSCSGYMKRVIKFKEDGTYNFVLDSELSKGDISVELLDYTKQKIMLLDCANRNASITAEKKRNTIWLSTLSLQRVDMPLSESKSLSDKIQYVE